METSTKKRVYSISGYGDDCYAVAKGNIKLAIVKRNGSYSVPLFLLAYGQAVTAIKALSAMMGGKKARNFSLSSADGCPYFWVPNYQKNLVKQEGAYNAFTLRVPYEKRQMIFSMSYAPAFGKRYILTDAKHYGDDMFLALKNNYDTPLKREWVKPLVERAIAEDYVCNHKALDGDSWFIYGEGEEDVIIPLSADRKVAIKDLILVEIDMAQKDLDGIYDELIDEGVIRIGNGRADEWTVADFNEYVQNFNEVLTQNVDKAINVKTQIKPTVDSLALYRKTLKPAQAVVVNGMVDLFERADKGEIAPYGILNIVMGGGKSIMSASIPEAYFNKKAMGRYGDLKSVLTTPGAVNYRVLYMVPPHLVGKTVREIKTEIPDAIVRVIDSESHSYNMSMSCFKKNKVPAVPYEIKYNIFDIHKMGRKRKGKEFYVISNSKASMDSGVEPVPSKMAYRPLFRMRCADCYHGEDYHLMIKEMGMSTCPRCGGTNWEKQLYGETGKASVCLSCHDEGKLTYRRDALQSACPECGCEEWIDFGDNRLPEDKGTLPRYKHVKGMICPNCNNLLMKSGAKDRDLDAYMTDVDFMHPKKDNPVCYACGTALWGKPDTFDNKESNWVKISYYKTAVRDKTKRDSCYALRGREKYLIDSNGWLNLEEGDIKIFPVSRGGKRVSPAKYALKHMKDWFDFLVLDEAHEYSGDSGRNIAAQNFKMCSRRTLALSGTIYNGKADSVFGLMFLLDPKKLIADGYGYEDQAKFTRDFGVLQSVYEAVDARGGVFVRGKKLSGGAKILPGISTLVCTKYLWEHGVNLELNDFSNELPEFKERIVLVEPTEAQRDVIKTVNERFMRKIEDKKQMGEKYQSLFSQWISYMLSYPDKPFGRKDVPDPDVYGEIAVEIPKWEGEDILPKEEKLIELVNTEMDEGRNVFVYAQASRSESDDYILERIQKVIEDGCPKARGKVKAFLSNTPKAENREAWLKEQAKKGVRVFICNPQLVETGMDFIFEDEETEKLYNYQTIIFFQMGYKLNTVWQASRRSYRIIQKEECRVFYLGYRGTVQEVAIKQMATKRSAVKAATGNLSQSGLDVMSSQNDARAEIARALAGKSVDRMSVEDMESNMNDASILEESIYCIPYDTEPVRYCDVVGVEKPIEETATVTNIEDDFFTEDDFEVEETVEVPDVLEEEEKPKKVGLFDSFNISDEPEFEDDEPIVLISTTKPKKKSRKKVVSVMFTVSAEDDGLFDF